MIKTKIHIIAVMVLLLTVGCKDETKVTSVSVNPEEMTLAIGETRQIELTINPTSAAIYNSKSWSSSDQNVAVVDNKGNVTAVYAGTCVITASVSGHKARCKVTVETPEYDLEMDNGAVYITGVDEETGAMTQVLRLYEDGLTMDEEGNVTGNGLMVSLALYSPAGTDTLTAGRYLVEESKRELTVKPGEVREEGGKSYVSGSFLGQYTDNGLSVLLLTAGSVDIKREDGKFSVECEMEGAQKELVRVVWKGQPARYRADSVEEPERILYSEMELRDTVLEDEPATRHTLARLSDGEKRVELLFRLPLSATGQLLAGRYTLSDNDVSYTVSGDGSFVGIEGQIIEFQSANLTVKSDGTTYEIEGSVRGGDGKDYVIERREQGVEKIKKNAFHLVGSYKKNQ